MHSQINKDDSYQKGEPSRLSSSSSSLLIYQTEEQIQAWFNNRQKNTQNRSEVQTPITLRSPHTDIQTKEEVINVNKLFCKKTNKSLSRASPLFISNQNSMTEEQRKIHMSGFYTYICARAGITSFIPRVASSTLELLQSNITISFSNPCAWSSTVNGWMLFPIPGCWPGQRLIGVTCISVHILRPRRCNEVMHCGAILGIAGCLVVN